MPTRVWTVGVILAACSDEVVAIHFQVLWKYISKVLDAAMCIHKLIKSSHLIGCNGGGTIHTLSIVRDKCMHGHTSACVTYRRLVCGTAPGRCALHARVAAYCAGDEPSGRQFVP